MFRLSGTNLEIVGANGLYSGPIILPFERIIPGSGITYEQSQDGTSCWQTDQQA